MPAYKTVQAGAGPSPEVRITRIMDFLRRYKVASGNKQSSSSKDGGEVLTLKLTKFVGSTRKNEKIYMSLW